MVERGPARRRPAGSASARGARPARRGPRARGRSGPAWRSGARRWAGSVGTRVLLTVCLGAGAPRPRTLTATGLGVEVAAGRVVDFAGAGVALGVRSAGVVAWRRAAARSRPAAPCSAAVRRRAAEPGADAATPPPDATEGRVSDAGRDRPHRSHPRPDLAPAQLRRPVRAPEVERQRPVPAHAEPDEQRQQRARREQRGDRRAGEELAGPHCTENAGERLTIGLSSG